MAAASKHSCIYCLWNSRSGTKDPEMTYAETEWPPRPEWNEENRGKFNAILTPLVPRNKIILPPLHIKIGLISQL